YAVWAYHRFTISFADVEDLLVESELMRWMPPPSGIEYTYAGFGRLPHALKADSIFSKRGAMAGTTSVTATPQMRLELK
ncbi:hypothetical protein, partial [Roseibium sp. RKSG952]|uniref:hypothetical protein n=1 Tax=Roseibium sp. RKSG952 TaxID=2529384 RepID=UPI001AD9484D